MITNYTLYLNYINSKLYTENMNNIDKLFAPNGKESNLSNKNWKFVRTSEFKEWFGDWENDKENASKVLDENGEPLLCYHGTNNNFKEFDNKKLGSNTDYGLRGRGFYFSPNKIISKNYGNILLETFLNIKNPFIPENFKNKEEIINIFNSTLEYPIDNDIYDKLFKYEDNYFIILDNSSIITEMIKDSNHDGIIYYRNDEVIVFDNKQIKRI